MKKSLVLKYISILGVVVFMATFLSACVTNKKDIGKTLNPEDNYSPVDNGVHKVSMVETAQKMIDSGVSKYKIIKPSADGSNYELAVSDLSLFLYKATGFRPEIISADNLEYSDDVDYISVGENNYQKSAGIKYTISELGANGVRIITKGKSIFLGGTTEYAVINSVYIFLEHLVGYRIYANDEIVFTKASDTIPFYKIDITEIPDFEWRIGTYGMLNENTYLRRMKYNSFYDVFIPVDDTLWHNTFKYIPDTDENKQNHPDWFSTDGTQLCFLARGNAAEKEAFDNAFFEKLKNCVIENLNFNNITITHQDVDTWCKCDACTSEKNKYGTDSATIIKFCNAMSDRLHNWIKSENNIYFSKDRVIKIAFFAYYQAEKAPVTIDSKGNYVPIDNDVICGENVYPFYPPIKADFNQPISNNGEENAAYAETMKKWRAISQNTLVWIYQTNFFNYLFPYNNFNAQHETYKFFKEMNAMYIIDQGQHDNNMSTAFHHYKSWLSSQLMWNVNLNPAELQKEYFEYYFKSASDAMIKLYNAINAQMMYLYKYEQVSGSIYFPIADAKYWSHNLLTEYMSYLNEAYESLEPLKDTDSEQYFKLKKRIDIESIFPRYSIIKFYPGKYSDAVLNSMKKSFKEDVMRLDFTRIKETQDIMEITNSWVIY